jgi:deazaflavin-dependent oxidoreductase (nitroreductase family)
MLSHVGRVSGRPYQTVLEVVAFDPRTDRSVVMSGWGGRSDWYRNVLASGRAEITIGRRTLGVQPGVLDGPEAARVLAGYETRNRLAALILRRVLGRLAGIAYDGSDRARLLVVQKLPLVAFTPLPAAGPPPADQR